MEPGEAFSWMEREPYRGAGTCLFLTPRIPPTIFLISFRLAFFRGIYFQVLPHQSTAAIESPETETFRHNIAIRIAFLDIFILQLEKFKHPRIR